MENRYEKKILTIPNVLSLFRIVLIVPIVWFYVYQKDYFMAGVFLILSGLTDVADGFIARKFNMISNVGKLLDPVADKVTQTAVMACLVTRYPNMVYPLCLLVLKETLNTFTGLATYSRHGEVLQADWHGKLSTFLLYTTMLLHIFWTDIPVNVSWICIIACTASEALSLLLYTVRNILYITKKPA